MGALRARSLPLGLTALVLALMGLLTLTWLLQNSVATAGPVVIDEPSVVRVTYDTIADIERLSAYDVWELNNTAERYVLVGVGPDELARLQQDGWRVALDANATADLRRMRTRDLFRDGYRTVTELYADLDSLAAAHPSLSEPVVYGESVCLAAGGCVTPGGDALAGYELRALRITNEAIPGSSNIDGETIARGEKPVFFLIANIHAREITTPEIAMRLADWLLAGYGVDADATWLVDHHEIWIVPIVNPDGHWLVELGTLPPYNGEPFSHRKNANRDANGDGYPDCSRWPSSSSGQFGVDLNRNHSYGWGPIGSSAIPCDLTYRGPEKASEPEVSSLEALAAAVLTDQREDGLYDLAPDDTTGVFITLHSYSELVLWPWGGFYLPAPNRDGLKAIGDKLAAFNGYTSCQPTDCLYAASGSSDDWAYGKLGVPAFTFEIGRQFMPDYSIIDDEQWPENKPAFLYAARIARTPYLTVLGPDSSEGTVDVDGGMATVQVTLDDRATGGNTVAAGEFTVAQPFWDPDHVAYPLEAADGVYDAETEVATGTLDISAWPDGRYLVYFRGQDSEGQWGAVSAAFVTVGPETYMLYLPQVVTP
jgi:hypothetical protein